MILNNYYCKKNNEIKYSGRYNIQLLYKLPVTYFHDFNKLSKDKHICTEKLIDIYCNIAINDLQDNITKMINHDIVCNKKKVNCIIDNEIRNNFLKKDLRKNFMKKNLS